mmetsp:Transcript_130694/g.194727  ORF Transcript_130694/g.194727 Transcript_130694/m.194727 type:complete len:120 (-) Transcript_130694:326-685(-)
MIHSKRSLVLLRSGLRLAEFLLLEEDMDDVWGIGLSDNGRPGLQALLAERAGLSRLEASLLRQEWLTRERSSILMDAALEDFTQLFFLLLDRSEPPSTSPVEQLLDEDSETPVDDNDSD